MKKTTTEKPTKSKSKPTSNDLSVDALRAVVGGANAYEEQRK